MTAHDILQGERYTPGASAGVDYMALWDGDKWRPAEAYSVDAFARLRVSEPHTLFDAKSVFDAQGLLFDDAETSGSGTGTSHDADTSSVTLSVGATIAGTRVRQSKRRLLYQPGKSQLIFQTFTMGAAASGITRRAGYFDDDDGIFLEQDGDGIRLVRRSSTSGSAVDEKVEQADWNVETFADLDLTKSQILLIDFEWLGVGTVRVGFIIDGAVRYAHRFMHANRLAGVYMKTPNLPIRWEIDNDGAGAASTFETICATVISEGGTEDTGISRSIDRGSTALSFDSAAIQPMLAVRLKSTALDATGRVDGIHVFPTSAGVFRWMLLVDPTVVGTALSFASVAGDSVLEAATAPTSTTTEVTGGATIASGYVESTNQQAGNVTIDAEHYLGSDIDGTAGVLVLAITRVSGSGTETVFGAMSIRESV